MLLPNNKTMSSHIFSKGMCYSTVRFVLSAIIQFLLSHFSIVLVLGGTEIIYGLQQTYIHVHCHNQRADIKVESYLVSGSFVLNFC